MKKCIGKALIADDTTDGGGRATQETKPRTTIPAQVLIILAALVKF